MLNSKSRTKTGNSLKQNSITEQKLRRYDNGLGHFLKSKPLYQPRREQTSNDSFELGYN